MKKSTRNTLIGIGITTAVVMATSGIVSHVLTKKLISVGTQRTMPEKMNNSRHKINGSSKKTAPIIQEIAEANEKLENTQLIRVETEGIDGVPLVGHLYKAKRAKRTVIAMHGWRSSWHKDFGLISDFLHNSGCNVLYVEQRGQGESGGEFISFGLTERYDCISWIEWLNDNGFSQKPIYLYGISMGSATVLMASGFNLPQNVHGIIADCGYSSPKGIWKHVLNKNLRIPYLAVRQKAINDTFKKATKSDDINYSCTDALKQCKVPVIFIHGTDDKFVPIEMTYDNYKACASVKRLLVVPGAGHVMSYYTNPLDYEKALKDFWKDYDKGIPVTDQEQITA